MHAIVCAPSSPLSFLLGVRPGLINYYMYFLIRRCPTAPFREKKTNCLWNECLVLRYVPTKRVCSSRRTWPRITISIGWNQSADQQEQKKKKKGKKRTRGRLTTSNSFLIYTPNPPGQGCPTCHREEAPNIATYLNSPTSINITTWKKKTKKYCRRAKA